MSKYLDGFFSHGNVIFSVRAKLFHVSGRFRGRIHLIKRKGGCTVMQGTLRQGNVLTDQHIRSSFCVRAKSVAAGKCVVRPMTKEAVGMSAVRRLLRRIATVLTSI